MMHWYVLRTTLRREMKAASFLAAHGIQTYVAQQYQSRQHDGKEIRKLENILPNMLFARLTSQQFEDIFHRHSSSASSQLARQLSFVSYCYDTTYRNAESKAEPLTIPDGEMHNFMLATETCENDFELLPQSQYPKGDMDEVLVVGGKHKGVSGRMMVNASGHKRILVPLKNLITIRMPRILDMYIQTVKVNDGEQ